MASDDFVTARIALVELNVVETILIAWCAILLDGMVRRGSPAGNRHAGYIRQFIVVFH